MTATTPSVTLDTRLERSEDVLFQEVGGEAVLLDLASEQYFGLTTVGTRIWELLDTHATLAPIAEVLRAEFEADPDQISTDLLALIREMLAAGLVKLH